MINFWNEELKTSILRLTFMQFILLALVNQWSSCTVSRISSAANQEPGSCSSSHLNRRKLKLLRYSHMTQYSLAMYILIWCWNANGYLLYTGQLKMALLLYATEREEAVWKVWGKIPWRQSLLHQTVSWFLASRSSLVLHVWLLTNFEVIGSSPVQDWRVIHQTFCLGSLGPFSLSKCNKKWPQKWNYISFEFSRLPYHFCDWPSVLWWWIKKFRTSLCLAS